MWLLEELNLDYDIKTYQRQKDKRSPPELKEVHPLGKSPVISVEAPALEKPLVLAESAAIVEYITDHFGKQLIPQRYPEGKDGVVGAETDEWLRYRVSVHILLSLEAGWCQTRLKYITNIDQYLMHFSEGSLMPPLIVGIITSAIRKSPVPFFLKFITTKIADMVDDNFTHAELKLDLGYVESLLAADPEGGFICGPKLTGADIMMLFVLEGATQFGALKETSHPKLYSYVKRMQARDAYKRAGDRVTAASGIKYVPFSESKL